MYPQLLLSFLRRADQIGPSIDSSTSMPSVRVILPLNPLVDVRLRSVSLLTPGHVNPVAEYNGGTTGLARELETTFPEI